MPAEEMNELTTGNQGQVYRSFLLRCWQEINTDPNSKPDWRFTLVQFDQNQAQLAFACLDDLVAHLRQQLK